MDRTVVALFLVASGAALAPPALLRRSALSSAVVRQRRGALSSADEQELLLTEPALNAFVCAEVAVFVGDKAPAVPATGDVDAIVAATRDAYAAAHGADVLSSLSTALAFLRPRFEAAARAGVRRRARVWSLSRVRRRSPAR